MCPVTKALKIYNTLIGAKEKMIAIKHEHIIQDIFFTALYFL